MGQYRFSLANGQVWMRIEGFLHALFPAGPLDVAGSPGGQLFPVRPI